MRVPNNVVCIKLKVVLKQTELHTYKQIDDFGIRKRNSQTLIFTKFYYFLMFNFPHVCFYHFSCVLRNSELILHKTKFLSSLVKSEPKTEFWITTFVQAHECPSPPDWTTAQVHLIVFSAFYSLYGSHLFLIRMG